MNNPALDKPIQLAKLFLKLGAIGFGGPAAHIAMMEDEVVNRREWLTRQQFLDLVGATNLIPGPNSTEMAIHIGYTYAGRIGLIVAGVCFILPAVLITAAFAWVYATFGQLPTVTSLLYGIKPVVLAVILGAVWRLGKAAVKNPKLLVIAVAVAAALFAGLNEIVALLLGGLLGMLWLVYPGQSPPSETTAIVVGSLIAGKMLKASATVGAIASSNVPLWQLGLVFLKIGSVLFGSGYVLVAFLESEVVKNYGWLTQEQLLDAIAIGQFTPGPLSCTATFIGYLISGWLGAIVATVAIFLPSFFFVAVSNPFIPRLRSSRWMSAFLDAINVSAIALMAAVTLKLAIVTLSASGDGILKIDWLAVAIAATAAVLAIRFRVNAAWLVLGGAISGLIVNFFF